MDLKEEDLEVLHKELLEWLKGVGYKRVSFSCYDKEIPMARCRGVWYLDSIYYYKGAVYIYPCIKDMNGRPALWNILDTLKLGTCGGNSEYYGLKREYAEYVGSYVYKLVKGKWERIPRLYDDIELLRIINDVCHRNCSSYSHPKPLDILSDDEDVLAKAKRFDMLDVLTCSMDDLPLYINDSKKGSIAVYMLKKGR